MSCSVRFAKISDSPTILRFIKELAEFEKASESVLATEDHIKSTLFGDAPDAHALIIEDEDGQTAGFAVYFYTYSTWRAQRGLFLEDLYITPEKRGKGMGTSMLSTLAQIALEQNCGRVEWNVLNWNEQAIRVYEGAGACPQSEWTTYRVDEERLKALATRSPLPFSKNN